MNMTAKMLRVTWEKLVSLTDGNTESVGKNGPSPAIGKPRRFGTSRIGFFIRGSFFEVEERQHCGNHHPDAVIC